MNFNVNKKAVLFWTFIIFTYLVTRLINLKIIPIFTDEAIYSYWAQVALHDPQHRYISLEDGKQPLFIWLAAVFQRFVQDPLIATRLVSIFAGFGSLIGIYLVAKNLFGKNVGKISTLLYLLSPFTLLYDRLALYDSLLTMLGLYAIYFTIKMVNKPSLGIAQLNAYAIGLATITKSSGNFFLFLLPFSLLLVNKKPTKKSFTKWAILIVYAALTSIIIYNALRLSPLFYRIAQKNSEFIRSPQDVISSPFAHFTSNMTTIAGWLITYLSIPLFALLIGSIALVLYKKNLKGIYLLVVIAAPLTTELLFNKVLYPRFVLFYFPYVLILIANCLEYIYLKLKIDTRLKYLLLSAFFVLPSINSFLLITNPTKASIPKSDSDQYLNSWPAGFGVDAVVDFFKAESQNKVINVATEGTFGLLPYALNIYLNQNQNIKIDAYWPLNPEELPFQITDLPQSNRTYLILYQTQKSVVNPKLKLLNSYQQGIGESHLRLYEVIK